MHMEARSRMHQTTVRFAPDLWEQLEIAARRNGVSAAQYIRDATLARMAYTAGQHGESPFAAGDAPVKRFNESGLAAEDSQAEAAAVWAQARLARERARSVRDEARAAQAESSQRRRVRGRFADPHKGGTAA